MEIVASPGLGILLRLVFPLVLWVIVWGVRYFCELQFLYGKFWGVRCRVIYM